MKCGNLGNESAQVSLINMDIDTCYLRLGLQKKTASRDDVIHAYKRECMRWHPDKHISAPQNERDACQSRFITAGAAYAAIITYIDTGALPLDVVVVKAAQVAMPPRSAAPKGTQYNLKNLDANKFNDLFYIYIYIHILKRVFNC
jgi:hypothetical protein